MKISIIGRGNAGCISAMYFAYYRNFVQTNIEIDLYYDSQIPPVPTGQGTTLDFAVFLFKTFRCNYLENFPSTLKTGIMYENFGKQNTKIFHPFPMGQYAIHFNPKSFQDFVCDNLKINFSHIDEKVLSYDSIDADYIIDCRGAPSNLDDKYEKLTNPLNCALLANLPKKQNDVKYTRSIAHDNGWCFYIPLPETTSLGYVFNNEITSIEDAEQNFKDRFGIKKVNKVFPFKQYVIKEPIVDDRVLINGNKMFFLEPLEATAMGCYMNASRFYYDYIFNNKSKNETVNNIKDYVYKLQDYILWHYASGSIYDTKFWRHAKDLWDNHEKEEIEKIIKVVKGMKQEHIDTSIESQFRYAQWQHWNFKNWIEGTS